jgi:hypothetical protein
MKKQILVTFIAAQLIGMGVGISQTGTHPVSLVSPSTPGSGSSRTNTGLSFASTSGDVTAPFSTNGGYVSQSISTGVSNGGRAVYTFALSNSGNYTMSANVNAPNPSANSFYVNIDAEPTDPTMIWDIPVAIGFTNQVVCWRGNGTPLASQFVPKIFTNLTAGVHQLIIVGREAGTGLGLITIAPLQPNPSAPVAPQNLHIAASQ